jgi:hypothetical protein
MAGHATKIWRGSVEGSFDGVGWDTIKWLATEYSVPEGDWLVGCGPPTKNSM